MKSLLLLAVVSLAVAGCVAVPVYDGGYYPYYGPYPYAYVGSETHIFVPVIHGGHGFRGGHGFHGGHGSHGGHR